MKQSVYAPLNEKELYCLFCSLKEKYDAKRKELSLTDDLELRTVIRRTMNDLERKKNSVVAHCRRRGFYPIYSEKDYASLCKSLKSSKSKKSPSRKKTSVPSKKNPRVRNEKKKINTKRPSTSARRARNKQRKA